MSRAFVQNLELGVAAFQDANHAKVLSISHNDGDGLTSSMLIAKTMDYLGIPRIQAIFERSESWPVYFQKILARYPGVDTVILTDLGAEERQAIDFFQPRPGITAFLLDHHKIPAHEQVDGYPPNVHSLNATRFGLDGLKEIAGATLAYMFCSRLTPRASRLAWLPVVGMAGDALENPSRYRSYNKEILEHAVAEDIVTIHEGAALLGGMAEPTIEGTLLHSLLPFLPVVGGSRADALQLLEDRGIDPKKAVLALDDGEIDALEAATGKRIRGTAVMIPGKDGLFRHAFEYNFHVGLLGDTDGPAALHALDAAGPGRAGTATYRAYVSMLASHLGSIAGNSGIEGERYKVIELPAGKATKQLASDVASFTSVNGLLPGDKLLVISSMDSPTSYKLSVRCSPSFVAAHGIGAGTAIEKLVAMFGGRGGGHDLAGGWNVPAADYAAFTRQVERIDAEVVPR